MILLECGLQLRNLPAMHREESTSETKTSQAVASDGIAVAQYTLHEPIQSISPCTRGR